MVPATSAAQMSVLPTNHGQNSSQSMVAPFACGSPAFMNSDCSQKPMPMAATMVRTMSNARPRTSETSAASTSETTRKVTRMGRQTTARP